MVSAANGYDTVWYKGRTARLKKKISFSTLGCPRWTWQEIVATAADLGYNGVEVRGVGKDVSVPSVPQFGEEQSAATLSQLRAKNLSIPVLASDCCIHLREDEARVQREVLAYIALAKRLDVPYIRVMAAAAVPQPVGKVDEGYVRERARALGEIAAESGVALLVETNGQWSDSEKLARLLEAVGLPSVQALWDLQHPYRYMGEPPKATLANLRPYLKHTHLKDSVVESGRLRYVLPGYGDVPLEETVGLLEDAGYGGFYSLEWVKRWDLTLEEPGVVFAHYASLMRSL